jgi:hypothetical protein
MSEWTIGTVEQSHVNPNSGYQAMADAIDLASSNGNTRRAILRSP